MPYAEAYQPDRSIKGKVRRQMVRFAHRRPLETAPDRPMISFAFDDAPQSATRAGARILESRGLRGTYYVASGLSTGQLPMGLCAGPVDYRRLLGAGHELACHTSGHLDCGQESAAAVAADIDRNAAVLHLWGAGEVVNFAYPYGDVSAPVKEMLGERFATVRALHHGVIEKGSDLNQVPAVGIEGPHGEETARQWMATALRRKAWLILFTHDVQSIPSPWGCMPEALERLVDQSLSMGFDVLTVRDAARRLGL